MYDAFFWLWLKEVVPQNQDQLIRSPVSSLTVHCLAFLSGAWIFFYGFPIIGQDYTLAFCISLHLGWVGCINVLVIEMHLFDHKIRINVIVTYLLLSKSLLNDIDSYLLCLVLGRSIDGLLTCFTAWVFLANRIVNHSTRSLLIVYWFKASDTAISERTDVILSFEPLRLRQPN